MLVNITIPVFNEETEIIPKISTLIHFLREHVRFKWEIVIASNGSTDETIDRAKQLIMMHPYVHLLDLPSAGRGAAIATAWNASRADIVSYMDVDLSTDLRNFPILCEAVISKGFDVAIGSRLLNPALTSRGFRREIISRCYNRLIKTLLRAKFSDAQCGFKAISRHASNLLLPLIEDRKWFFDTELLVYAQTLGLEIFDLPVRWKDDPDSRVKILRTCFDDICGIYRVRSRMGKLREIGGKDRESGDFVVETA